MNIDLKQEKISYVKPIFRRKFSHEEILEVIVPDTQPDVLRVLNADGTAYIRSKDSDTGHVSAAGTVECAVLFIPEDGEGIRRLDVNVPFSVSADAAEIEPDSLIIADVSVSACEAKLINSRKLLVKTELMCTVECFNTFEFSISSAGELRDVFAKSEQRTLLLPSAVGEKSFIFSDELKLKSGSEPIGEILRSKVTLSCDEIKPVGRKAVVKGNAYTEIAYCMKESSRIETERFTSPFSQIVETDSETEPAKFTASLMLTSVYVSRDYPEDAEDEYLNIEIHAVAQCTAYSEYELNYVSDVYSPKYELTPERQELVFELAEDNSDFSDTVRGSIPVENPDNVCLLSVTPCQIICVGDDPASVTVVLNVSMVYEDRSGSKWQVAKKLECKHDFDMAIDSRDVSAVCGECFSAVSNGEVELRIPITISVRRENIIKFDVIEAVEYDENTKKDNSQLPSITVIKAGNKCGLWELSKKYGSSIELITAYNNLDSEQSPVAGSILLIPRIR